MHPVNVPFTNLIVYFWSVSAAKERQALKNPVYKTLFALLLLVALGAVTGCATSFFYERADRFANRWVAGYVTLNATQQAMLDAGLAELHAWHRREQLPAYADWLRGLAARLAEGPSFEAAELQARGEELVQYWRALAEMSLPLMSRIGTDLEDDQVAELLETLREEHASESKALDRRPASWEQQRRARSMERFLRRFTGRLTTAQRDAIGNWSQRLEPSRAATLENRAGWVEAVTAALGQRDDQAALEIAAHSLFVAPAERWSPDYAALAERNSARTMSFMADFLNRLEDPQRARAVERLERLAEEFEQLSRNGG